MNEDCATPVMDAGSVGLSGASTTPSGLYVPNDDLAANLANLMRSPQKAITPNSAKKRRHLPDLSRSMPSPGHGARMSTIFRNASASLQGPRTPPGRPSSNMKRSRVPLSQARKLRFGSTSQVNARPLPNARVPSLDGIKDTAPTDSGFSVLSNPCSRLIETSKTRQGPNLGAKQLPQSSSCASIASSFSSGGQNTHFSHEILGDKMLSQFDPNVQCERIDSWLESLPEDSDLEARAIPLQDADRVSNLTSRETPNSSETPPNRLMHKPSTKISPESLNISDSFSRASSDKENLSPVKPTDPIPQYFTSPASHFSATNSRILPSPSRSVRPLLHQGNSTLPPKPKKVRLNPNATGKSKAALKAANDFTIHDDQLTGVLAELSPLVECHRKGRGSKRNRRVSFADDDIIQQNSTGAPLGIGYGDGIRLRDENEMLGESRYSAKLTKADPFVVEADTASFDFKG